MKQRQGKYLNRRRYEAEGSAYYAIDPTQGSLSNFMMLALGKWKSPCPYTRWWKERAWWRGYMKAREKVMDAEWAGVFSFADATKTNTYPGIDRFQA